jgi:hypothetical protein
MLDIEHILHRRSEKEVARSHTAEHFSDEEGKWNLVSLVL